MFRIALISRWHVHAQTAAARYTVAIRKRDDCQITCVWDEDPAIAAAWGAELGVDYETDLEKVLSRTDVDGVVITSKTSQHKDIMIAAAKHGKHIFTEKPLTFDLQEAYEIRQAVEENKVQFCIAFPHIATKQFAYAKKLIEEGTLGDIVMFRCLNGHRGGINGDLPEYWFDPDLCGGGAMMDLGCHPFYLASYLFGEPESVSSTFTYYTKRRSEDNASCNVLFQNGTMALIESTFTSALLNVYEFSVYGTKGSYYARVGKYDPQLAIVGEPLKTIPYEEIPEAETPKPIPAWILACAEGIPAPQYDIDQAIRAVRFMQAAYESHRQNGLRIQIAK